MREYTTYTTKINLQELLNLIGISFEEFKEFDSVDNLDGIQNETELDIIVVEDEDCPWLTVNRSDNPWNEPIAIIDCPASWWFSEPVWQGWERWEL